MYREKKRNPNPSFTYLLPKTWSYTFHIAETTSNVTQKFKKATKHCGRRNKMHFLLFKNVFKSILYKS